MDGRRGRRTRRALASRLRGTRERRASRGRGRPASAGGSNCTRGRGRTGRECNRIGGEESGGLPNIEGNWKKRSPHLCVLSTSRCGTNYGNIRVSRLYK